MCLDPKRSWAAFPLHRHTVRLKTYHVDAAVFLPYDTQIVSSVGLVSVKPVTASSCFDVRGTSDSQSLRCIRKILDRSLCSTNMHDGQSGREAN